MGGLNSPNPYSDGLNGGGAGGDFWSQLSATNAELDALQEKIRSVSQAHQQTLVSAKSPVPVAGLSTAFVYEEQLRWAIVPREMAERSLITSGSLSRNSLGFVEHS